MNTKRQYQSCSNCGKPITLQNIRLHEESCVRRAKLKAEKLSKPKISRVPWNKGLSKETSDIIATQANALAERFAKGELQPKGYRGWSKEKCREVAKSLNLGGYRENAGRSKKFKVNDSFGKLVCLQSSYEMKCAQVLNELGINWIRPSHLKYGDKKYFPDFYLTDYKVYLDPKNDYLMKKDADKIRLASTENNVIIYMIAKEDINVDAINSLLTDS